MCNYFVEKLPAAKSQRQHSFCIVLPRGIRGEVILATAIAATEGTFIVLWRGRNVRGRWIFSKHSRVKFVSRDLMTEHRFDLTASLSRNKPLGGPLLNRLRGQAKQIAERCLASSNANGFSDSSFHVSPKVTVTT
jgi:hypothetical protein